MHPPSLILLRRSEDASAPELQLSDVYRFTADNSLWQIIAILVLAELEPLVSARAYRGSEFCARRTAGQAPASGSV